MTEFSLPVLGLEKSSSPVPTTVVWRDGTVCGILNLTFDPEGAARYEAEQARNEQIRQSENVVLLSDFKETSKW